MWDTKTYNIVVNIKILIKKTYCKMYIRLNGHIYKIGAKEMRDMNDTVIVKQRMRSIYQALDMLRAEDPDTAVTYGVIRDLIAKNLISYTMIGKKYLINFDSLLDYLKRI